MIEELPPSFMVNPAEDGPLLIPVLGAAAAELDAKVAAAAASLDELEAFLAALEHRLCAEADRPRADETLEGLGYAIAQLATETADLGRRRDELADWLARCRRPVRSLRFAPRARFAVEPLIDPAEFERRLNERRAELAQVRVRIVQALRHRAEIPNRQQEAPEA